ncbi:MAG TPA: hypothetical protein DEA55_03805 [Rhodospirillaceae bacterium]|nr:hypothetical protein [Rhodospirillaceae bacterium]
MASKAKIKSGKKKSGKRKSHKMSAHAQLIMAGFIVLGTIFLPTTFLLCIGMLPTPAAALWDRGRKMTIVVAVGAMNLAGCTPYLLKLWAHGNSFDKAFDIVTDPKNIIVMYAAAGVGYVISWAMTDITASILYKRGRARQKEIRKIQERLVERWGKGVTGDVPLDPEGFPVE